MTTFDYAAKRDTGDRLLTKFGQAVSLRRITATGSAWEPTQSTADYATVAALVDYDERQIDGENIQRGDRRALVAAGPLTVAGITGIAAPDCLVIGGVAVPVIRVQPINPAGVVVVYDVQLRF